MANETIENVILNAIRNNNRFFHQIEWYANQNGIKDFRAIDRRLQALRKKGKIKFAHPTGWSISE